jgi:predicted AAA+ superfamily ATPase
LNDIFDLSKIDWLKAEDFAITNAIKKVCNMKIKGLSVEEIANKMKISSRTVFTYLKKGRELGWIKKKSNNKKPKKKKHSINRKKVICVENGMIFKSCMDLERQSEKIFGTKLLNGNISPTCLGTKESYKGFHFKYI